MIDPVGTGSTNRRPGFTDDGRPLLYRTMDAQFRPAPKKLTDIDFLRLAMRNPKKLLDLDCIANHRRAQEFIHQKFAYCPLFYFDHELSLEAARLSGEYYDVMLRLMSDIRLPFPAMIICYEGKVHYGLDEFYISLLWEAGSRIRSQGMAVSSERGICAVAPFSHGIDPDPKIRPRICTPTEVRYGTIMRAESTSGPLLDVPIERQAVMCMAMHMLGVASEQRPNRLNLFIPHFEMMEPIGGLSAEPLLQKAEHRLIGQSMLNGSGQAVHIAALLVLLNLRDYVTRISEQPAKPGRYRYRGVSAPYMTTRVVTLTIPEPKVIRALKKRAAESIRSRQRRHSVRGHWCLRTEQPSCIHLFTKIDENHMRCSRCDGLRYWRKAHESGDASLGYVRHEEYKVEHAREEHPRC